VFAKASGTHHDVPWRCARPALQTLPSIPATPMAPLMRVRVLQSPASLTRLQRSLALCRPLLLAWLLALAPGLGSRPARAGCALRARGWIRLQRSCGLTIELFRVRSSNDYSASNLVEAVE